MKNTHDIQEEKRLIFLLSDEDIKNKKINIWEGKVAIAINLYYEDTIEKYMDYVNKIPEEFDIFIISSKIIVLNKVNNLKKRSIFLIEKDNQGRDISALLVAFREYYFKYKYICFLHDKKANHKRWEKDTNIWIKNIWENMIGSSQCIYSILSIFEKNTNIGLLVPPEPLGEYYYAWYGDAWNKNLNRTKELAKDLKLKCEISLNENPLTIGTAFWSRRESLNKLLEREWKYEDFPQEPLPLDGTINHAIERILGYVAQDAGYNIGIVMSNEYASWTLSFVQNVMRKMYSILDKRLGIHTVHQLNIFEQQEQKLKAFCEQNSKIYLYGAGTYGRCTLQILKNLGYSPSGFIVGNGKKSNLLIEGIKVYELDELIQDIETGIIITVDYNLQEEVEQTLKDKGIINYIVSLF